MQLKHVIVRGARWNAGSLQTRQLNWTCILFGAMFSHDGDRWGHSQKLDAFPPVVKIRACVIGDHCTAILECVGDTHVNGIVKLGDYDLFLLSIKLFL